MDLLKYDKISCFCAVAGSLFTAPIGLSVMVGGAMTGWLVGKGFQSCMEKDPVGKGDEAIKGVNAVTRETSKTMKKIGDFITIISGCVVSFSGITLMWALRLVSNNEDPRFQN